MTTNTTEIKKNDLGNSKRKNSKIDNFQLSSFCGLYRPPQLLVENLMANAKKNPDCLPDYSE